MQAWVERWKAAGSRMEELRRKKLRKLTSRQVQAAMLSFQSAFRAAQGMHPSRKTSGLVEMQAWFRRMRT